MVEFLKLTHFMGRPPNSVIPVGSEGLHLAHKGFGFVIRLEPPEGWILNGFNVYADIWVTVQGRTFHHERRYLCKDRVVGGKPFQKSYNFELRVYRRVYYGDSLKIRLHFNRPWGTRLYSETATWYFGKAPTPTVPACPIEIASCKVVGQQVVITVKVNKLDNYVFYANDKPFDIRFLSPGTHTLRYPLSKFPRGSVTISVRRAGFI